MAHTIHAVYQDAILTLPTRMLASAALWLRKRRAYRQTYNELASLRDAELTDLGLHRSMLRRVSKEAADKVL